MKYRIKFTKNGPIKYIGHLDVMRYFQKAIRRAELPVKYSDGFSPHQILSFAFPLSVGYTSEAEYFDIEMTEEVNIDYLISKLNEQMVSGISVSDAVLLPEKSENCMASVFAAGYIVSLKEKMKDIPGFKEKAVDYFSQMTIPVNKPKKKGGGFLQIDLKEYIYDFKAESDRSIYFICNASSDSNIKPTFVMECLLNHLEIDIPENALSVHRTEIYKNISELDGEILLKPLIDHDEKDSNNQD